MLQQTWKWTVVAAVVAVSCLSTSPTAAQLLSWPPANPPTPTYTPDAFWTGFAWDEPTWMTLNDAMLLGSDEIGENHIAVIEFWSRDAGAEKGRLKMGRAEKGSGVGRESFICSKELVLSWSLCAVEGLGSIQSKDSRPPPA
jgi:hypothetical protein